MTVAARTIKVRIAVAVDSSGRYAAEGHHRYEDHDSRRSDLDDLTADEQRAEDAEHSLKYFGQRGASRHVVFVEAEIPVPEPATVAGQVVGAKP